jgi:hypothetical protein
MELVKVTSEKLTEVEGGIVLKAAWALDVSTPSGNKARVAYVIDPNFTPRHLDFAFMRLNDMLVVIIRSADVPDGELAELSIKAVDAMKAGAR